MIGPLFKWFGSKWLASKRLPAPSYGTIVEPFAGGAGYSLRHSERQVILSETDPHLCKLWPWLIYVARQSLILEIPIGVPEGTDIRTLGLSDGQALLLKTWQRTNNVGDCWTISPWGNKPGQWTANTRARVSEEVSAVSHWRFATGDANELMADTQQPATWLIDPPYLYNYRYRGNGFDHSDLAVRVQSLRGQIIACEARCPKTDAVPNYLPFVDWHHTVTSRRKAGDNIHSKELIWTREDEK
jgi:site-specific DNA-adenine methylase